MTWMIPCLVGGGALAAGWAGWNLTVLWMMHHPKPFASSETPFYHSDRLLPHWARDPWAVFKSAWSHQRTLSKLREVFPQALGMTVQALKSGRTVPQTLLYLSQESAPPLRGEFSKVCSEMGLGASADMALANLVDRYKELPEFSRLLESYRLSRTTGSNLGQLLQTLLDGLEERNRLVRKMEAMTAQARLSGTLMGLLPFVLGTVLYWMDPVLMRPLFTEPSGWGVLLLAAFLEGLGFLWIRRLLRLEV